MPPFQFLDKQTIEKGSAVGRSKKPKLSASKKRKSSSGNMPDTAVSRQIRNRTIFASLRPGDVVHLKWRESIKSSHDGTYVEVTNKQFSGTISTIQDGTLWFRHKPIRLWKLIDDVDAALTIDVQHQAKLSSAA